MYLLLTITAQWQHFLTHADLFPPLVPQQGKHKTDAYTMQKAALTVRDSAATALEVVWHMSCRASGTGW